MTTQNKEASFEFEQRVEEILSQMNISEKISQLTGYWMGKFFLIDDDYLPDREKCEVYLNEIGHLGRPCDRYQYETGIGWPYRTAEGATEFVNKLQKYAVEFSRFDIPILCHEECLHGYIAAESTCFPQPIALASSWDEDLIERVYSIAAREVRAAGAHMGLTPVLDVARDARWGRVDETFGEDPYLIGRLGVAAVNGLQGRELPLAKDKIFATLKHFIGHSMPESGRNLAPINYSPYHLREVFIAPFETVLNKTNIQFVMPSFNEINGEAVHGSKQLLTDLLRGELNFEGLIVSDYMAINNIRSEHCTAKDNKEACEMSFNAGVDLEYGDKVTFMHMEELVNEGRIDVADIDCSVKKVLRLKFLAGLFDNPYVDAENAKDIVNNQEAQAVALEAAQKACTLLKNKNDLLPINPGAFKNIAVIGPNADHVVTGGYSTDRLKNETTIFQGIKSKLPDHNVQFSIGVRLTESEDIWNDNVPLYSEEKNRTHILEAVELAEGSDLVVLVLGENTVTAREAWHFTHPGDRDSLDLLGQQEDLLKAMIDTGKKIILVLNHARPMTINYAVKNVPAIIDCWYCGQATGEAVADVILGNVSPGGRLPISIPRSVGQVPCFYNRRKSSTMPYLYAESSPLFPFGFGLTYTQFEYSELQLNAERVHLNQTVSASVTLTNIGQREGVEVVQLYINDVVSKKTRPDIELKGFKRVSLEPGESVEVNFSIGFDELCYHRDDCKVVEPGEFQIMIGPNSAVYQMKELEVLPVDVTVDQQENSVETTV